MFQAFQAFRAFEGFAFPTTLAQRRILQKEAFQQSPARKLPQHVRLPKPMANKKPSDNA